MTRINRFNFPGERSWLSANPKPRDFKSLNIASMPHHLAYARAVAREGFADIAMNHGSSAFSSWSI